MSSTAARSVRIATYLRGLMAERRIAKADAADALGMPATTFGRKINGQTPFTFDEADELIRWLGLSFEHVMRDTEV